MTVAHTHIDRRQLLRGAFWTSLGGLSLLTLPMAAQRALAADSGARWDRTLVALQLNGGNDGLNTVIPYADPAYRLARPRLAIASDQVLQLGNNLGFHPAMEPLRALWNNGAGDLALALGVGYPRQNRSHFRSIDIWETASESDAFLDDGWIGRLFGIADSPETLAADGVILGGSGLSLASASSRKIALPGSGELSTPTLTPRVDAASQTDAVAHVMGTQAALAQAATAFRGVSATRLSVTFPSTNIGRQLEQAAKIIVSGKPVPVIMVSHGSFDTHAGQAETHRRLLAELAAALVAFRSSLVQAGVWDKVAVASFAEFGRRVGENGSQGTDHGAASCHFVFGGGVRGGFYGMQPSLTNLDGGDLRFNLDFRSIYTSVAREFWGMSAATAGSALGLFSPLSLFRTTTS